MGILLFSWLSDSSVLNSASKRTEVTTDSMPTREQTKELSLRNVVIPATSGGSHTVIMDTNKSMLHQRTPTGTPPTYRMDDDISNHETTTFIPLIDANKLPNTLTSYELVDRVGIYYLSFPTLTVKLDGGTWRSLLALSVCVSVCTALF